MDRRKVTDKKEYLKLFKEILIKVDKPILPKPEQLELIRQRKRLSAKRKELTSLNIIYKEKAKYYIDFGGILSIFFDELSTNLSKITNKELLKEYIKELMEQLLLSVDFDNVFSIPKSVNGKIMLTSMKEREKELNISYTIDSLFNDVLVHTAVDYLKKQIDELYMNDQSFKVFAEDCVTHLLKKNLLLVNDIV